VFRISGPGVHDGPDWPFRITGIRTELETVERQLTKLRGGIGRLIDSYADGVISEAEFEPQLAGMRQRVTKLEVEATALQNAAEQAHSLQLVIGKLETFATLVRDQLDEADWTTRRDLIRTLVRRIEVDDQHVRVVFRVGPEPQDRADSRRMSHLCPGRGGGMQWRQSWFSLKGKMGIRGQVREEAPTPSRYWTPIVGSVQQGLVSMTLHWQANPAAWMQGHRPGFNPTKFLLRRDPALGFWLVRLTGL